MAVLASPQKKKTTKHSVSRRTRRSPRGIIFFFQPLGNHHYVLTLFSDAVVKKFSSFFLYFMVSVCGAIFQISPVSMLIDKASTQLHLFSPSLYLAQTRVHCYLLALQSLVSIKIDYYVLPQVPSTIAFAFSVGYHASKAGDVLSPTPLA